MMQIKKARRQSSCFNNAIKYKKSWIFSSRQSQIQLYFFALFIVPNVPLALDELPEAINILKGDMSVIGPRPQLVRDMVFMTTEQRRRHNVRPGLSGLTQVRGRNAISWEGKLATDLEYIEHITFIGDVKIVFQTVGKFIKLEDITAEGMATIRYLLTQQY